MSFFLDPTISAALEQKIKQKQHQQKMVSSYLFVRLSGVSIYWAFAIAFIGHHSYLPCATVCSCVLPYAPGCSCVLLCIGYASESASFRKYFSTLYDPLCLIDSFILWVLNAISSNPPECPIIYIVRLWIGISMSYCLLF